MPAIIATPDELSTLTLDALLERRQATVSEVQALQAQLGDRDRHTPDGERMSDQEYWVWRKKAQHALRKHLEALRVVKSELRRRGSEELAQQQARPRFGVTLGRVRLALEDHEPVIYEESGDCSCGLLFEGSAEEPPYNQWLDHVLRLLGRQPANGADDPDV